MGVDECTPPASLVGQQHAPPRGFYQAAGREYSGSPLARTPLMPSNSIAQLFSASSWLEKLRPSIKGQHFSGALAPNLRVHIWIEYLRFTASTAQRTRKPLTVRVFMM